MRFSDALDRKLEEIKRPPNLPIGNYVWQVAKHPDQDTIESSKTGATWDRLTFTLSCVSAHDDVDEDELAAFGNVQGQQQRKVFLFTQDEDDAAAFERTRFNLKRFLGHLGIDIDDGKITLSEALADSVGAQCLGEVTHRPDPNDPEIVYSEVGRTAEL